MRAGWDWFPPNDLHANMASLKVHALAMLNVASNELVVEQKGGTLMCDEAMPGDTPTQCGVLPAPHCGSKTSSV